MFPGLSDTSIRKLAESCSEISNRIGKDRTRLRWSDVVDTTHGENIVFPTMRQSFVVRSFQVHLRYEKGPWRAARLQRSIGAISMFVGSGNVVSAGSSGLSDMGQCQPQRRERSLVCMTDEGDVEQCSIGRELSGDETDSASVKTERRRSPTRDCSSTKSSGGWEDERMRAAKMDEFHYSC